ncbi:MAG TPA: glycosyltransferase family 1 protein [Anaerolineales bacterium]|nr:glycosyltransferase family 1 protein [Anaerolineales bacterium]
MKVGVFFPGFDPSAGGGYTFEQEILRSLLQIAPQSRHSFTLFFAGEGSRELPAVKNLKSVWVKAEKPPSKMRRRVSKAAGLLGWQALVLTPEVPLQKAVERESIEFFWFPTVIYRWVDIPYIATVWDIQHRNQPWFPEVSQKGQWDYRESYYSTFLKRATYILTPNAAGQAELALFYQIPAGRFRKLPHPVPQIDSLPSTNAVEAVLKKYEISRRYLFYPAQFWAHKNHANLLKALRILLKTYHLEFDLVLCGSNQGNLPYLQSLTEEMELKEHIHFLDFIPREDMIALYSGAFALTYVTFFGPENLPPLEAFACGCPVIASDVDGAQEQFGDAALRVDPMSPEQIAQAVKDLNDNPELRLDLISRGRARSQSFSSIDYVHGVLDLVDEFEPIRINWK